MESSDELARRCDVDFMSSAVRSRWRGLFLLDVLHDCLVELVPPMRPLGSDEAAQRDDGNLLCAAMLNLLPMGLLMAPWRRWRQYRFFDNSASRAPSDRADSITARRSADVLRRHR